MLAWSTLKTVDPTISDKRKDYIVESAILLEHESKSPKNIFETCKNIFFKRKSSVQDFQ